ncbi:hypothetical protein GQ54DRAFT_80710 [Martensiomyces pterosporus]|nr:hypothetical protein GQ54DRAFT_80710 [Martensiomyces pterosporus]
MGTPKLKLRIKLAKPLPARKLLFICTQRTVRELKCEIVRRLASTIDGPIAVKASGYELLDDDEVSDLLENNSKLTVHTLRSTNKRPAQTEPVHRVHSTSHALCVHPPPPPPTFSKYKSPASAARNNRHKKQRLLNRASSLVATATAASTSSSSSHSASVGAGGVADSAGQIMIPVATPAPRRVVISSMEHGDPNKAALVKQKTIYPVQKAYDNAIAVDGEGSASREGTDSTDPSSSESLEPSNDIVTSSDSDSDSDSESSSSSTSGSSSSSDSDSDSDSPPLTIPLQRLGNADGQGKPNASGPSDSAKIASITLQQLEEMDGGSIDNVSAGALIAYQVLEISREMTPVVSQFRIGRVERASHSELFVRVLKDFATGSEAAPTTTDLRRQQLLGDAAENAPSLDELSPHQVTAVKFL